MVDARRGAPQQRLRRAHAGGSDRAEMTVPDDFYCLGGVVLCSDMPGRGGQACGGAVLGSEVFMRALTLLPRAGEGCLVWGVKTCQNGPSRSIRRFEFMEP